MERHGTCGHGAEVEVMGLLILLAVMAVSGIALDVWLVRWGMR